MAGLKHREYKKPMKWFAIPQLFRYERQQRGRLREHFQWNCDIIGEPGLGAEAELLAVLASALQNLGLKSSDFVIRLSDRQFWVDFLNEHQVPAEKHYDFFQALDKMERAEESETRAKLGPLADKVYAIFANGGTSPRLDALAAKLQALGLGDFFQIDLKIIRGLAYYTGIVFEVHDRAGVFRAIAGGGRYDNLLKQLSGTDLPAIGFGMGDVVLLELLKDKGLLPPLKPSIDFFIVLGDESRRLDALALAGSLRQAGFSVDYALSELKFPKQLDLATDRGARYGLVVDAAFDSGRIGLRDLATRTQVEIGFTRQDGTFSFDPPLPRPGI
jgi:histidyl-tRNA synthetase